MSNQEARKKGDYGEEDFDGTKTVLLVIIWVYGFLIAPLM